MKNNAWKLKDVLLIAICAVLFGVVYLGCTYVGGILYGILTPFGMASLGYEPFYGIYFMAGAFGVYVMRKPGAGPHCRTAGRRAGMSVRQLLRAHHYPVGPCAGLWV